jgi:glycosyltransferase involved in cell wall biosynthesis
MAAQVLALLSDPERATAMGRRAQWRVREKYDWKQLSRQVMQVLEQAAAARSPAKEAA